MRYNRDMSTLSMFTCVQLAGKTWEFYEMFIQLMSVITKRLIIRHIF